MSTTIYKTSNVFLAAYLSGIKGRPVEDLQKKGPLMLICFRADEGIEEDIKDYWNGAFNDFAAGYEALRKRMREISFNN